MKRGESLSIDFLYNYLEKSGLIFLKDFRVRNKALAVPDVNHKKLTADLVYENSNRELCLLEFKASNVRIDLQQILNFIFPADPPSPEPFNRIFLITPTYCFDLTGLKGKSNETIKDIENILNSDPQSSLLDKYRVYELLGKSTSHPKIDLKKYFLNYDFENIYDSIASNFRLCLDGRIRAHISVLFYIIKQFKEGIIKDIDLKSFTSDYSVKPKGTKLLAIYNQLITMNKGMIFFNSTTDVEYLDDLIAEEGSFFDSTCFFNIAKYLASNYHLQDNSHSELVSCQEFINCNIEDFVSFFISKRMSSRGGFGRATNFDTNDSLLKFITSLYNIKKRDSVLSVSESFINDLSTYMPNGIDYTEYSRNEDVISELVRVAKNLEFNSYKSNDLGALKQIKSVYNIIFFASSMGKRNEDIFSISLILDRLSNTGKALMLLPESVLYSKDRNSKVMRRKLVDTNLLDLVITIPSNMIGENSNIKMCLIGIDKEKNNELVTFVDFETLASSSYDKAETLWITSPLGPPMRKNQFDIISDIRDRRTSQAGLEEVDISEIEKQDYNFSVSRYTINNPEGFDSAVKIGDLFKEVYTSRRRKHTEDRGIRIRIRDLAKPGSSSKFLGIHEFNREALPEKARLRKIDEDVLLVSNKFGSLYPTVYRWTEQQQRSIYIDNNIFAFNISEFSNDEMKYYVSELNSNFVKSQLNKYLAGAIIPYIRRGDLLRIRLRDLVKNKAVQAVPLDNLASKSLNSIRTDSLKTDAKERDGYLATIKEQLEEIEKLKIKSSLLESFYNDFDLFIHGVKTPLAGIRGQLKMSKLSLGYYDKIKDQINNIDDKRHDKEIEIERLNIYDFVLSCFDKKIEKEENNNGYDSYTVDKGESSEFILIFTKKEDVHDEFLINANSTELDRCIAKIKTNIIDWGFSVKDLNWLKVVEVSVELDVTDLHFVIIKIKHNGKPINNMDQLLRGVGYSSSNDPKKGRGLEFIKQCIESFGGSFSLKNIQESSISNYLDSDEYGNPMQDIADIILVENMSRNTLNVSYEIRLPLKK